MQEDSMFSLNIGSITDHTLKMSLNVSIIQRQMATIHPANKILKALMLFLKDIPIKSSPIRATHAVSTTRIHNLH